MLKIFISNFTRKHAWVLFFQGFSSGIPLLLVSGNLTLWLREEGASLTHIGFFSLVTLPYTLKFMWAPLLDTLKIPYITRKMGRRRSWMLFSQCGLVLSIVFLGLSHPQTHMHYTALAAFFVTFFSSCQDITVDAYRIESMPSDQQALGAALNTFGYRIGLVMAGAGGLALASYINWDVSYKIMAVILLLSSAAVFFAHEIYKEHENDARDNNFVSHTSNRSSLHVSMRWMYSTFILPFTQIKNRSYWYLIILFVVFYRLPDAFIAGMINPFLVDMAFIKLDIARIVKLYGLIATLSGTLIGVWLVKKFGMWKSLLICGLSAMFSNFIFIVQAKMGNHLGMLILTTSIENIAGGMSTTAYMAFLGSLCNLQFTATQYALFSSFGSMGRVLFASYAGMAAETLGWDLFFCLSVLIGIPGLALLLLLMYLYKKEEPFNT